MMQKMMQKREEVAHRVELALLVRVNELDDRVRDGGVVVHGSPQQESRVVVDVAAVQNCTFTQWQCTLGAKCNPSPTLL